MTFNDPKWRREKTFEHNTSLMSIFLRYLVYFLNAFMVTLKIFFQFFYWQKIKKIMEIQKKRHLKLKDYVDSLK